MTDQPPPVVVSDTAFASEEPYDIIMSNIDFVNALFENHLEEGEIAVEALRSYYVDYFFAQINNGGFSQFVYNSRWGPCIPYVTDGLRAIGATKHLALFEEAAQAILDQVGADALAEYFDSEYFGDNAHRDVINRLGEGFFALEDEEDLVALNAQWLRQLPNLSVMSSDEMDREVERRIEAVPNHAERVASALANEPRFMKAIRLLCEETEHVFDRVTAGDPSFTYEGQQVTAWNFLTDRGHFQMVDTGEKAVLMDGKTNAVITQVDLPPDFG